MDNTRHFFLVPKEQARRNTILRREDLRRPEGPGSHRGKPMSGHTSVTAGDPLPRGDQTRQHRAGQRPLAGEGQGHKPRGGKEHSSGASNRAGGTGASERRELSHSEKLRCHGQVRRPEPAPLVSFPAAPVLRAQGRRPCASRVSPLNKVREPDHPPQETSGEQSCGQSWQVGLGHRVIQSPPLPRTDGQRYPSPDHRPHRGGHTTVLATLTPPAPATTARPAF